MSDQAVTDLRREPPPTDPAYYFRPYKTILGRTVADGGESFYVRGDPAARPGFLRLMVYALPLPWIAIETGWILAEVGRQPWIVYGVMKTANAVSRLATVQVATSLVAFVAVYGILGFVAISLIVRYARKGPVAE